MARDQSCRVPTRTGKRNIFQVAGEDGVNSRQVKGKAEGFIKKKIGEEHESLQSASRGLNLRGMMTIAGNTQDLLEISYDRLRKLRSTHQTSVRIIDTNRRKVVYFGV